MYHALSPIYQSNVSYKGQSRRRLSNTSIFVNKYWLLSMEKINIDAILFIPRTIANQSRRHLFYVLILLYIHITPRKRWNEIYAGEIIRDCCLSVSQCVFYYLNQRRAPFEWTNRRITQTGLTLLKSGHTVRRMVSIHY